MNYSEWSPFYDSIRADFGFDQSDDENSVRILRAVTLNSDLIDLDGVVPLMRDTATVVGNGPNLESDLESKGVTGTLIVSGSAVGRVLDAGLLPDMVTTDLDGDFPSQMEASAKGAVTLVLAHGDNQHLVSSCAPMLKGPVMLTTQSVPQDIVFNFGGFTDGDRAVCLADHLGVRSIRLIGFDFDHPTPKPGSDPEIKRRKLQWAKRIIDHIASKGTSFD